jgi:hypothetical protein
MENFVNLRIQILGKEIFVCISNGTRKASKLNCDILGLRLQCYTCLKKDSFFSGYNFLSIEAITICTYLNYDLSSIENVNLAVSKKAEVCKEWNNLHSKCDGNWDKMLAVMTGSEVETYSNSSEVETYSNSSEVETYSNNENRLEALKSGDIALRGISRNIVYNIDSISLVALANTGGLSGILDNAIRIQDENIFLEDIRSITVYEGKGASNVLLNSVFGGNTNKAVMESISYIRLELKGVNDIRTYSPSQHPYTVTISSTQINEAKELKTYLENKIREFRNSSRTPNQYQLSSADELLKYSNLLEKGIISKEEFDSMKKKLLGL